MGTPVLSKKQLKSTLSSKKNRTKETLKNVLATPYNVFFWPEIASEDHQKLHDLLIENLPFLRNTAENVAWDKIKHIPKSERKAFKKLSRADQPNVSQNKSVVLGVNEVTKLLEKNSAGAVLLNADVQPRILVQHILDQAILHKVPILIFDKLKSLLKKKCGIPSIAFAIDKNISSDSRLNLVKETIENIFQKCPIPENHINYNRSLDPYKTTNNLEETEMKQEDRLEINEDEIRKSVFLKRPSTGRAFVPKEAEKVISLEVDKTGFIPFTEEAQGKLVESTKNNKYKSLIVKRLKGDKTRNIRKVQSLKKKLSDNINKKH